VGRDYSGACSNVKDSVLTGRTTNKEYFIIFAIIYGDKSNFK